LKDLDTGLYKSRMDNAYQVCINMFQGRKYTDITQHDDRITATKPCGNNVCAFFLESSFNNDRLKEYMSLMNQFAVQHCLVVVRDGITPHAKNAIKLLAEITLEIFSEAELQYDITKHRLQPNKFERLSDEAAATFKKKFGMKGAAMLRTDPIARFYLYQKGDIIRIHRPKPAADQKDLDLYVQSLDPENDPEEYAEAVRLQKSPGAITYRHIR
jgi:DNA-directed RNA polymerase subunit H (RpoH/RPB5)